MNFAKAVNLAMRNGFAKFATWFANFAMRNFAKVLMRQMNSVLVLRNWHCEIGIAKLAKLALRNSHCEIGIAKFALRNWHCEFSQGLPTHCEFWQCEISLRFCERRISQRYSVLGYWISQCEIGCQHIAKFAMVANCLRTVCENLVLLIFHAFRPVFNCISFFPLFLCFSIEFWAC